MSRQPHRSTLETALRNAARWSLYLSLLVLLLTGGVLYGLMRDKFKVKVNPWYGVDFLEYRSVRDLQQLVRIDTTHQSGREMDAALWLQEQLMQSGIRAEIEDMGDGKANLVAKIEGQTDEFVVLHNHLDTDPVGDLDRWTSDPWSAHIEVVWLYARGSFDMKSTVIAQLHAMQALQAEIDRTGQRPRRGLMLLSTSSEETGSHEGAQHIVANRPELLDGAWALLSEGGVVEAVDINSVKYFGIGFGQKRFVDVWYSVQGNPPDAQQTLETLRAQIARAGHSSERQLTPSVLRFLEIYGPTRQLAAARSVLSDPEVAVNDQASFDELPDFYKSLFREEVHTFPPTADAPDGGLRMRIVLHLLEGTDLDQAMSELLPNAADLDPSIETWVDPSIGSERASPLDHPAFETLVREIGAELEDGVAGPYYLTYFANDTQYFRKLGIPSYGVQPFFSVASESYSVGTYDERIALPTFIEGVHRYSRVLWKLIEAETLSATTPQWTKTDGPPEPN